MSSELSLSDLQIIEGAVMGVNGNESTTLENLNIALQVVEIGTDYIL